MNSKSRASVSGEDLRSADAHERETLLEHDSDPDEDMLFSRSSASSLNDIRVHKKIESVKIQIRDVTDVMRDNVQKVLERGERLEDLQMASDRLNIAGNEFRDAARRAQRRAWMQNIKSRIIIIAVTVTIILCIVGKRERSKFWMSQYFIWFSNNCPPPWPKAMKEIKCL